MRHRGSKARLQYTIYNLGLNHIVAQYITVDLHHVTAFE